MNSAELLELGTQPVRPDAPAGDPGRDSPEFEALQTEVRKLEHPDQPNPDWNLVVSSGTALLRKSKDLMASAYFCVGLLEREGYPGLAVGLTVVRDLVANFWETLYPEKARLRGRTAAIEWLAERGAQRVRRPGRSTNVEAVATCLERVSEIGDLLAPHLDSGASLLRELRDALEEVREEASTPAPAPRAAAAAGSSPATGAGPASIATAADFDQALGEARRLLRMAGEHLRSTDSTNPIAYRMPRFATWMAVKQLPPHAAGKTQIPPPQPPDLGTRLQQALAAGQWPGVLQETEGRMATSVFWLDLHRFAALALEGMGDAHRPAADAICEEMASLLRRFPELPELRFANDEPLASPETRKWIAERVQAAATGAPGASAPASGAAAEGDESEFEESRSAARELARQKRLPDALRLLHAGAARSGGLKPWVDWQLEIVRLCLEHGHESTALAQLEAVDERLRNSTIEEWEPQVCVEVLKSLLLCRRRALANRTTPEDAQRSRELMSRLTRLDVVAAVELNGRH